MACTRANTDAWADVGGYSFLLLSTAIACTRRLCARRRRSAGAFAKAAGQHACKSAESRDRPWAPEHGGA